jgi:hypothetical protein
MSKKDIKVQVTTHDGFLIIETIKPQKDEFFIPAGGQNIGCVLSRTNKFLGMSKEAFELLKTIKTSYDGIGDVMAWKAGEDYCFGWLGGLRSLIDIKTGDVTCSIDKIPDDLPFIQIKNEIPVEAFEIIVKSRNEIK